MSNNLEKEFQFFLDHKDELVKFYNGKYVVIKGQKVIGAYASELEATATAAKDHELGSFLVQKIEPGEDSYKQTYRSRVQFA